MKMKVMMGGRKEEDEGLEAWRKEEREKFREEGRKEIERQKERKKKKIEEKKGEEDKQKKKKGSGSRMSHLGTPDRTGTFGGSHQPRRQKLRMGPNRIWFGSFQLMGL